MRLGVFVRIMWVSCCAFHCVSFCLFLLNLSLIFISFVFYNKYISYTAILCLAVIGFCGCCQAHEQLKWIELFTTLPFGERNVGGYWIILNSKHDLISRPGFATATFTWLLRSLSHHSITWTLHRTIHVTDHSYVTGTLLCSRIETPLRVVSTSSRRFFNYKLHPQAAQGWPKFQCLCHLCKH
jgi:hypothetical protein